MTYNRKSQITPYTERENTMTETTNTKSTKAARADETTPALITDWANSVVPESFDRDQAAVHQWMEADDETRLHALETQMTLADAEELAATARALATEHTRRAERARNLVTIIAARLGREAEALHAVDPVTVGKAVPVQGAPKPAPTATRKMELPSAL